MKKYILLLMVIFGASAGCDLFEDEDDCCEVGEGSLPDLFWNDIQPVYNPCTGQTQVLNVSRFFWVNNLTNPYYPPQVLLYYDDQSRTFTDCLGYLWFIYPGSTLVSNRYMKNREQGGTARRPSASSRVTVRESNGNTHEGGGDIVTFNDMPPGDVATLPTIFAVDYNNAQYLAEYTADPYNDVEESNESNNIANDGFSRQPAGEPVAFEIHTPSEEELAKIKERFVIYRDGKIEIKN